MIYNKCQVPSRDHNIPPFGTSKTADEFQKSRPPSTSSSRRNLGNFPDSAEYWNPRNFWKSRRILSNVQKQLKESIKFEQESTNRWISCNILNELISIFYF